VKSIQLGQRARISIDAFPGIPLEGELTKIAVLPDSQNRWMNPDLKVYNSTIRIDGFYDWLKPGMTAEAEILVKKLDNAVYVPLQAVTPVEDGHVCYVQTLAGAQARNVKVGEFNNTFIEIVSGLDAGETVLLRAPTEPKTDDESGAPETKEEEKKEDGGGEETATESAA
jgi:multidrug efflux pump subunit AcrA (membrane-fusion protein)